MNGVIGIAKKMRQRQARVNEAAGAATRTRAINPSPSIAKPTIANSGHRSVKGMAAIRAANPPRSSSTVIPRFKAPVKAGGLRGPVPTSPALADVQKRIAAMKKQKLSGGRKLTFAEQRKARAARAAGVLGN